MEHNNQFISVWLASWLVAGRRRSRAFPHRRAQREHRGGSNYNAAIHVNCMQMRCLLHLQAIEPATDRQSAFHAGWPSRGGDDGVTRRRLVYTS